MLADGNTVYKLIGPVLVKQVRAMLLRVSLQEVPSSHHSVCLWLPTHIAILECLDHYMTSP